MYWHGYLWTVITDVLWHSFCVCLLGTAVGPAKTDEPIEMLFREQIHMSPRRLY